MFFSTEGGKEIPRDRALVGRLGQAAIGPSDVDRAHQRPIVNTVNSETRYQKSEIGPLQPAARRAAP
jgi:hypothetical protein